MDFGYIAQPGDYWISQSAINISLNALGEADRIQVSVASGAVIMCWIKDVKAASAGDDYAGNGDGLDYGVDHQPRRWPISLSPTYFNSHTAKYVYVAIPRSASVGSVATVVFPSEIIDIYGRAERTQTDGETGEAVTDEDGNTVTYGEQVGSTDYFYIFLQGIITSSGDGTTARRWQEYPQWGKLDTFEQRNEPVSDAEWYRWEPAKQLVTFLKEIAMSDDSRFRNLKAVVAEITQKLTLGTGDNKHDLTGVATKDNASAISDDSTTDIVTPSYLDEFGNTRYLSKVHDDTAAGKITFQDISTFIQGLKLGAIDSPYGIDGGGAANLYDIIFHHVLKSLGASKGFTNGRGIYMDADEGLIETDGLNVRGFMRVMELIINRLQLMESDYSFTEGDTVEQVDYYIDPQTLAPDGTLVLTMHKDHDNDYTPFYPGDIIYGIKNDLLDKAHTEQMAAQGHTVSRNASYFHTWMRVISVDLTKNQLHVALYQGKRYIGIDDHDNPRYEAIVPGGTNFSPMGTAISTDVGSAMTGEYTAVADPDVHSDPADPTSPVVGYETMLTVTRHGNVADGIDPETGEPDEHILASQQGRQQSWVLSTTDKRLSMFWNVDTPIIRNENYALCLGILPDLPNLPTNRNPEMPSLYVNTLFADHTEKANWPAKVVKVDRGQWRANPIAKYTGESGTYTPDGTLPAGSYYSIPTDGEIHYDDNVNDPYHFRAISVETFLRFRLFGIYLRQTDVELLENMRERWHEEVDLETSRVWNHGALWECLVDGTTQEPEFGCTDWQFISGGTFSLGFYTDGDDPMPIMGLAVRPANVDETVKPYLLFGQEDVSNIVTAWRWERQSQYEALDEAWGNSERTDADDPTSPLKSQTRTLHLTTADLPAGWEVGGGRVGFKCTATFLMGGEETEIMNNITIV